ncbi:MAG TPA: methylated-DNA--[protein]-cysteine S-methyltransferase [Sphaerochaeta sp.]|nr:methylated-DNA--[protein]-cysteine S-methyltransferase [Sphaerochaeta sp.]
MTIGKNTEKHYFKYDSPFGPITLASDGYSLTGVDFGVKEVAYGVEIKIFSWAKKELDEYFAGKRKTFTVPLQTFGTPFQQQVWASLLTIPYGETRSYEDVAIQIGNPKACRAIGMANNRNNIGIIIPCHRVIGKDGSLVGYGGGLDKKIILLDLEKSFQ